MKKLFLIIALGVVNLTCSAQIQKVVLKPSNDGLPPQVVLDSIKKAFPDPIAQTITAVAANKDLKMVEVLPADESVEPLNYEVFVNNKSGNYYAVYDNKGNLLKVRQVLKNIPLPETVKTNLTSRFTDWDIVTAKELMVSGKKTEHEYRVLLKKGLLKKSVVMDSSGNIKYALPTV